MRLVGEGVQHRDRGGLCELVHLALRVRAHGERVEVAGEHARRVGERLAARELQLFGSELDSDAAELRDRNLERDARARRVLAEEEAERTALEQAVRLARGLQPLQLVRTVEDRFELGRRQVADPRQRAAAQLDGERLGQRGHPSRSRAAATAAPTSAGPGGSRGTASGGTNVPARTCAATDA